MSQMSQSVEDRVSVSQCEKSPRRLPAVRRRLALMGAVMATLIGGLGLVPVAAQASGTTLLTGTAVSGTARWANAAIGVYQYENGGWHWDGYSTRTNNAGNYSLRVASGYAYEVIGFEQYGSCTIGYFQNLWGHSVIFRATTATVNAQVTQYPALTQTYRC